MNRAGFTLIELMIAVSIMLILYVMMLSPLSQSFQDKQKVACQRNLELMYLALKMYAEDNALNFPAIAGAPTSEAPLSALVPRYTTETRIFICPGSRDRPLPEAEPFPRRKISYAYYMGRSLTDGAGAVLVSDEQVDSEAKIQDQLVFSADGKRPGNNHAKFGGNFLFCDGHVEASPAHSARDLSLPANVTLLNPKL
jgi:prepilin-type N-terminal cleavage/methylation domain-containing protein/prepilin-type processing-associated H-X9-DG protein